jgi:hypothetical protein
MEGLLRRPEGRVHEETNPGCRPAQDAAACERSGSAMQQGRRFGVDAYHEAKGEKLEETSFPGFGDDHGVNGEPKRAIQLEC